MHYLIQLGLRHAGRYGCSTAEGALLLLSLRAVHGEGLQGMTHVVRA